MAYKIIGADDVTGALPPKVQANIAAIFATKDEITGGVEARSAYQSWLDQGNTGTEADFIASLKGADGRSAYQVAVANGFQGTSTQFIESLKGADGRNAYQVAQDNGFVGTESEWIESLKGDQGNQGVPGIPGDKGDKGDPGTNATITDATAVTGDPGTSASVELGGTDTARTFTFVIPRGDQGLQGIPGEKGDKGDMGTGLEITGSVATTNDLNTLPSPAVNDAYVVNDTGLLHIYDGANWSAGIPFKGDKGDKGDRGDQGLPGTNATISSATATTSAPGTAASVTVGGTSTNRTFSFTIPRGDKGDKGDPGNQGIPGEKGDPGNPGPSNTLSVTSTTTSNPGTNASVTISGTSPNQSLAFTVPRGDKGDKGDTGNPGADAAITGATATTGAAGTQASVSMGGTPQARSFTFTIPRGDKGEQGNQGIPGEDGPSAYEVAVANGFVGTEAEWITSLKGEKGDKGDRGTAGTNATITGATATTGLPGTNASVSLGGTDSARTFSFTIPRGDKGDKGDKGDQGNQGIPGTTPTVGVGTVTTGAAGSSVSITEGGTATARTFNFTIPRGDKGDPGTTTWAGIIDKPTNFPSSPHTHDDRYYTETEVNNLLTDRPKVVVLNASDPLPAGLAEGTLIARTD